MGYHLRAEAAAGPREARCATGNAFALRTGVGSGYRYYSPELGRWVNRDPIEEGGGLNLYCMIGNAILESIDSLGHKAFEIIESQIPGMVDIVLVERELSRAARRAARRSIREGLRSVSNVIADGTATGGFHQFSSGLADRLGQLSNPGDRIEWPRAEVVSAALDIYALLRWVHNDADQSYLQVARALHYFSQARTWENCFAYCDAVFNFIADIPTPLARGMAWLSVYGCYDACCRHVSFYR